MEDHKGFTRRSFLTGSVLAGAAVASLGLTACAPTYNENRNDADTQTSSAGDWLGEAPDPSSFNIENEVEVDVCVVGCSDSGTIAVRAAAEAGASVAVIEKSESLNSMGGDVALINGDVQAKYGRNNFTEEDITEMVNMHQMESSYKTKSAIMRRYANEIADVFDWIVAADPDVYYVENTFDDIPEDKLDHAIVPARYPLPDETYDFMQDTIPTYHATVSILNLKNMLTLNFEKAQATGKVTEFFGHFAELLIQDDEGAVTGVYARNAETGGYVAVKAKAVVLCTGDYCCNNDMLAEFAPTTLLYGNGTPWYNVDVEGNLTATGDGHRLGTWAGARMQDYHAPMIHHMGGGAGIDGRGVMGINGYLNLNLFGERFMDEDVPGQQVENQVEIQPQSTTFQFFDSSWPEQVSSFPAAHGVVCYYVDSEETTSDYAYPINIRSQGDIAAAVESGRCFTADTIDELLAAIQQDTPDFDVETAKASIERYNELCAKGVDEDFGKSARRLFALENAPFYATKFEPAMMLVCIGGLESDENCHTFTEDRKIIPGLYVAGNVQGNRFAVQYPISLCGLSVGMAMFYGKVAGENAAAYALA